MAARRWFSKTLSTSYLRRAYTSLSSVPAQIKAECSTVACSTLTYSSRSFSLLRPKTSVFNMNSRSIAISNPPGSFKQYSNIVASTSSVLQSRAINSIVSVKALSKTALRSSVCKVQSFSTTCHADSQMGLGMGDKERQKIKMDEEQASLQTENNSYKKSAKETGDWGVRLSNENGYLSWCRNTYLATVVAIAMLGEGTTAMAVQAAEGAFLVAGFNLTWGTYQFVYNVVHLRRSLNMSRTGAVMNVIMAVAHLFLWFMVCSLYMGYSDDAELKAAALDKELRKQGRQDA